MSDTVNTSNEKDAGQRWISVDERMPEVDALVVVCGLEHLGCAAATYSGRNWYSCPGRWTLHPTHWMPLMPPAASPLSKDGGK